MTDGALRNACIYILLFSPFLYFSILYFTLWINSTKTRYVGCFSALFVYILHGNSRKLKCRLSHSALSPIKPPYMSMCQPFPVVVLVYVLVAVPVIPHILRVLLSFSSVCCSRYSRIASSSSASPVS